ncbi:TPA: DEAD/DEAH box helicase family protein [Streptococcus suis]|uniref:DEAD/DEAH box helicase family protein n=1 Tax=Streptococcus suis TaxID=1307 RepID=UPI000CF4A364|nr:DEAD/DEAH box helicase family protein [Streptococcus suis]NJW40205.1 DEAD/DEAH box helicase family protein [Streptococcus suis]HEM2764733.1 DEAD/DEAH box helicase family protein [Streptococcus suis]HEM3122096.1 DEAD/DEAH box helicase family protein [Streptococcus suis]HEM3537741.1 DEAD/DEAH box helicase family protein [Streptococcus suis]HEM3547744.1 DEAD/DEAH box helicase family protein [Streptococcus suis]
MTFIYETYDTVSRSGFKDFRADLPDYLTKNLKHPLRPYQQEAIGRYLHYKTDNNRVIPEQVLYNMATGSGKTLLMATIILEKYQQGERNFIFFVNNDNILTKTKDNFLESASGKYLFAEKIVIDGQIVTVREVTDFSDSRDDSINIVFTTIQKLHQDLNTPRENRLSYEQFKDISVVMLADEAHHLNAGLSKSEKDDNTSWTSTIETIQKTAKKSSIFEFTATIDLTNQAIAQKYQNSLLFKYDLKEFRLDKYSKDVLFHLVDGDVNHRMLQAIIISQYRKKIALKNGINLKPLVMFKSQKIAESQENLDAFLGLLDNLSLEDIQAQRELVLEMDEKFSILKKAFSYFETVGISDTDLVAELQEDFRKERLLLVDGKNKNKDSLHLLNTLEQPSNEIRAIFAVDMLNEGWDVLNLFDIVRLYDTRDGKTMKNGFVPGKTTNTEKQLIGRGARYFPFVIGDNLEEKYIRKFDDNENNELRVIEQLHYHSANNPRYISELKQVLRESGIFDDQNLEERELKLKESFKKTRTYTDGVVWMNRRLSYEQLLEQRQGSLFDTNFIPKSFEVKLPTHGVRDIEAFDEATYVSDSLEALTFKFSRVIGDNIARTAINRNKKFSFDNLQKAFVALGSVSAFIGMLADIDIRVESQYQMMSDLTPDDKLYITEKLLHHIEKDLIATEERFFGSEKFEQYKIKDLFEDNILRKYTINHQSQAEFGLSQKNPAETQYFEDLDNLDWYAYDDNFGTSEEKLLVRLIKDLMVELEEKWTDIYLLRNEKAVKIYSFDRGQAFEPDFLMFANDKNTGNVSWQIFIEPKGSQFLDSDNTFKNSKEGWKQEFLHQISERDEARTLVDDDRYRIVGLPFFNEVVSKDEVREELRRL